MRRIYAPIQFGSLWWTGRWGCRGTPRADAAGLPARRFAGSDWAPPVNAGESGARAPCSRSSAKVSTTSTMTLGCWGSALVCLMAPRRTYPQLRRGYLTAAVGPRPTMSVHRYRPPNFVAPITRIVPHRELHLRPQWQGCHGVPQPTSVHPSHVSWPLRELHRKLQWQRPHGGTASFRHIPDSFRDPT